MKKILTLFFFVLLISVLAIGQKNSTSSFNGKGSDYCSQKKMNSPFLLSNLEGEIPHTYNVLNYKIDIDIYNCFLSPYPKNFSGSVIITFKVDSSLNSIPINAVNTSLSIDSVGLNGVSFNHANNILTVTLNRTYAPGETASVKINYRHLNVTDQAFNVSNGMVFTDAEPEGARKWYPCWDRPSDKAKVELRAKVPATVKLGSNGGLFDSTKIADTIWYHWKSRDNIATYLVVISAKVNYGLDIIYWRKISNPNDSIPIRFYYNSGENISSPKQFMPNMMTYYSQKFGEHPFEKNGFATLNNQFTWGGMENQTLTSLCPNCWSENLLSHEFAHQWFGDMITCETWADITLNEGFATYCEALWLEKTGGYSSYKSSINGDASQYLGSNPGWPIYNPSWAVTTPNVNTLFNTAITYSKGSCVLHMLRYTLGDSLFFKGIYSYANNPSLKYWSAFLTDLQSIMSANAGQDLTWFFEQWYRQPNHPTYANKYYLLQSGSVYQVGFQAIQTQTNTVFFKMPIEIKIGFSAGGDTTVRVLNDVNNQWFVFNFNKAVSSVQFDPNNNIVLKQATLTQVPPVPVELTSFTAEAKNNVVILKWKTATETNNKGFEIERTIGNNQIPLGSLDWEKIGFIKGNGTSVNLNQYSFVDHISKYGKYTYRLMQIDFNGDFEYSGEVEINAGEKPNKFILHQNYPNPFNPETIISFELPNSAKINLSVYNSLGQLVEVVADGFYEAGINQKSFNAKNLSSGIYFYVLKAEDVLLKQKMIVVK